MKIIKWIRIGLGSVISLTVSAYGAIYMLSESRMGQNGSQIDPFMPWKNFSKMTDIEIGVR